MTDLPEVPLCIRGKPIGFMASGSRDPSGYSCEIAIGPLASPADVEAVAEWLRLLIMRGLNVKAQKLQ